MRRYRYRTHALVGPWRESQDDALRDAARAGQLVFEGNGAAMRWMVAGEIEERLDQPAAKLRNALSN